MTYNERADDLHQTQTELDNLRRKIAEDYFLVTTLVRRLGYEAESVEAALDIMLGNTFREGCARIGKTHGQGNVRYVCGQFHKNNDHPPFLRPYFGILSKT